MAQVLDLDLVYGFVPQLQPYFDLEAKQPETLEELFWASLEDDQYRKKLFDKILALQAEEEALVRANVDDASVGESQVLAPLAGEDALEHIPGLA